MTEKQMTESLGDALPQEIQRVQELIPMYESVQMGFIAGGLMRESIRAAHEAMIAGDVVAMLQAYGDLKGYKA
ncbi:hypothetical protein [Comamonas koreensis]|uniref:hypothetical protein n=1 Tax=Comamonas koreensis TaxID=160825 RepID=UPI0015FA95A3|nr:hypothetical protein [Comamonas koreensis]